MSYAEQVGARLRQIRLERQLSLQDVERLSDGEWKAAVVGSYERGDRNISAARLCQIADFYGVAPSEVLPEEDVPRPPERERGLVFDVSRLEDSGQRWDGVRRYCRSIQMQRGDYNRGVLSLRSEDLRALAVVEDVPSEELLEDLRASGILVE